MERKRHVLDPRTKSGILALRGPVYSKNIVGPTGDLPDDLEDGGGVLVNVVGGD